MHIDSDLRRSGTSFSEQIARGMQVFFDFAVVMIASMACWAVIIMDRYPDF